MTEKIRVQQIKSGIGKPKDQKATLKGLGFKKMNQIKELEDTAAVRGMIRKVNHLVQVLDGK